MNEFSDDSSLGSERIVDVDFSAQILLKEVVHESFVVQKTLESRVHVAGVSYVLQSNQSSVPLDGPLKSGRTFLPAITFFLMGAKTAFPATKLPTLTPNNAPQVKALNFMLSSRAIHSLGAEVLYSVVEALNVAERSEAKAIVRTSKNAFLAVKTGCL